MTFKKSCSDEQIAEMRRLRLERRMGREEIAQRMNVSVRTVSRVLADLPLFPRRHTAAEPEVTARPRAAFSPKAHIAARFAPGCQPRAGR